MEGWIAMKIFHCFKLRHIFLLAFIMVSTMASSDVGSFFPDIKGNLTKITWAHAVNNMTYLRDTLSNENIMMIEADVVLGQVDGTGEIIPIMGHPPAITSDLSLISFFFEVKKSYVNTTITKKKGVKLDFKSIEAFEASIETIKKYDKDEFPIWLNADILPGPLNATTTPVDADKFLSGSKSFSNSTLSIGWTTLYGSNYSGSYEADQIQKMIDAIAKNTVVQDITFPVRAGLAAESVDLLTTLVGEVNNSTITVWSSEGDSVNVEHLRQLIAKIGLSKTYVDVPTDLLEQLRLDDLPGGASRLTSNTVGVVLPVLVALISYFKI